MKQVPNMEFKSIPSSINYLIKSGCFKEEEIIQLEMIEEAISDLSKSHIKRIINFGYDVSKSSEAIELFRQYGIYVNDNILHISYNISLISGIKIDIRFIEKRFYFYVGNDEDNGVLNLMGNGVYVEELITLLKRWT